MAAPARARSLRAVPKSTPRAVIYVRQSTHREESISLELQETSCREHCARHGYRVVEVIADPGISGRKWDKRPGIQKVLKMANAGEVDRVIVWRWSRLARRGLYQHLAIDTVERTGAVVESSTEPFDTKTAGGQFGRDVMFASATFDSNLKGEQWREALQRRRQLGLPATGRPRFGYTRITNDGPERYEPNDDAETLRWMYEAYIGGMGFVAIARRLQEAGVRNVQGRKWHPIGVSRVLDSGFGAGLLIREEYRDDKPIKKPFVEREWLPGAHQAVVEPWQWDEYCVARLRRANDAPRTINPSHPLAGLVFCGDDGCGRGPMNRKPHTGTRSYTFYCTRHVSHGVGLPCNITEPRVHEKLFDWLGELARDVGEAAEQARDAHQARLRNQSDAERAQRELDDCDAQLERLTLQLVAERIPESVYDSARDTLLQRRAEAERELARAGQGAADLLVADPPKVAAGLLEEWDTLPVLQRREVLRSLIRRVEIVPDVSPGKRRRASVRVIPAWAPVS